MSACEAEGDGSIPFEHPIQEEKIVVTILTRPTLVLNRIWQPVGVASVARSLTLVAAERARIVDPTDFQQYTWADWAKLVPQEDEPFVQSLQLVGQLGDIAENASQKRDASIRLFGREVFFSFENRGHDGHHLLNRGDNHWAAGTGAAGLGTGGAAAGFGGGGGSGGFVQTGAVTSFDAATAVGLRLVCPHANSTGSFAKSTRQPSRLYVLMSWFDPMKM